ncbi:MAG TPA: flagellar biosynthesis protein FliQ [Firmicutes bacterium]|jgi:flagellar biosynthetic protein FliQ|nr:flagellar biosynthesis protein FliQ [Bacillota bacterium]
MAPGILLEILREAIKTILIMVAPILGFSLLVGLTVSIFQAMTQIQEQTLAFVPKIVAVLLVLFLLGGWIMDLAVEFTARLWSEGLVPF